MEQEAAVKMQEEFDLSFRMKFDSLEAFNLEGLSEDNIKDIIEKALDTLPERCREIFVMSKIEGKKQKEKDKSYPGDMYFSIFISGRRIVGLYT